MKKCFFWMLALITSMNMVAAIAYEEFENESDQAVDGIVIDDRDDDDIALDQDRDLDLENEE